MRTRSARRSSEAPDGAVLRYNIDMVRRSRSIASILLLLIFFAACGASARTKTLRVSLVSLNAARDTLLALSKERETQIVDHAATKEEGREQLDTWRASVDKVVAAIDLGYHAIYAAAILDDAKSLEAAVTATAQALEQLKDLKP